MAPMRALDVYLQQFDHAWRHNWESLAPLLESVTEPEASWQASCYRDIDRDEGWPPPGSIHWHVAHLAHCKRDYTAEMRGLALEPHLPAQTFAESVHDLEQAHAAQRDVLCSLSESELGRQLPNEMTLAEFLTSTIRHDTWHAGQVAAARRLYAVAGAGETGRS